MAFLIVDPHVTRIINEILKENKCSEIAETTTIRPVFHGVEKRYTGNEWVNITALLCLQIKIFAIYSSI